MKRITYSVLVGSLALALCAPGAMAKDKNKEKKGKSADAPGQAVAAERSHGRRGIQQSSAHRKNAAGSMRSAGAPGQAVAAERSHGRRGIQQSSAHRRNVVEGVRSDAVGSRKSDYAGQRRATRQLNTANRNEARQRNFATNRERDVRRSEAFGNRTNVAVNRERNVRTNRFGTTHINRTRNVTVVNNWRGERFRGHNYVAFHNYRRTWHDRDWWHHHHSHITFVLGGWWYWNAGYWYPAWGYDRHAYYPYDGPIYTGYATLTPDQVVLNVQVELQREGYYPGPIDGDLGPMTRRAIAAFQADHGLAITSAIDEPTLSELGVA